MAASMRLIASARRRRSRPWRRSSTESRPTVVDEPPVADLCLQEPRQDAAARGLELTVLVLDVGGHAGLVLEVALEVEDVHLVGEEERELLLDAHRVGVALGLGEGRGAVVGVAQELLELGALGGLARGEQA